MRLLTADLNKTKIELLAADSDIQATLEQVNSTLKNRVCIKHQLLLYTVAYSMLMVSVSIDRTKKAAWPTTRWNPNPVVPCSSLALDT